MAAKKKRGGDTNEDRGDSGTGEPDDALAEKPVVWLEGEIKTPPFSEGARLEAGGLIGMLQNGHLLPMPFSRPMPGIGTRCHELRVRDENRTCRIIYRLYERAVVVGEVFAKKTEATPTQVIRDCQRRFRAYDEAIESARKKKGEG